ncbi:hypothetical protein ZWY2020_022829 [Hordeum vulgare]|nr:hypothetical protein ZWY2020_022829 [Hordeum vulgare]
MQHPLFASWNAEYVAVAIGNRIYILRKSDGYESPCGIYTNNNRMTSFTNGAWLEDQGIFGVVDDSSSLCLIKENGDMLTRRTSNQLKLSSPIIDLLVQDASRFLHFTTDCKVHKFDYTQEPEATLYQVSIKTLLPLPKVRISPQGKCIATLDFNGSVNIFVLDGNMRLFRFILTGVDISWWTDNIIIIVKEDGKISMYNIDEDMVVSKGDLVLSTPLLEKAKAIEGYAFVLQSSRQMDSIPGDHQHTEMDKIFWSLVSFSKVTVLEMYSVLIRKNRQRRLWSLPPTCWLHSAGDIHDIQSYLMNIKDQAFVLSECVNKSSIIRLRLLWYNDLLETFLGINMGRFSAGEYSKFRLAPLVDTAIALAESGKIGALNLLMKRHPYTISSDILRVLSAIPETIAVQTYSQLLPGKYPPSIVILRDGDWVECKQMASYINISPAQLDKRGQVETEILIKHSTGFLWPSVSELSEWYRSRARDIDCLSGQLENCLAMIELACQKGIVELQSFLDDMKYLYQVVYSDESNEFIMNLATWEDLPDYQKFKIILKGTKDDTVVQRLNDMAIPFMNKRLRLISSSNADKQEESYLTRWMKEVATENELSICLSVIENGCGESPICGLFKDLNEMVETAICCIYVCSATNQWNTMSPILSKLLHKTKREKSLLASEEDFSSKDAKQALGTCVVSCDDMQHVDSYCNDSTAYQFDNIKSLDMREKMLKVPKPTHFFLAAHLDEKNVKQLIRLILSKFGRRQPLFQEKAFPFLDSEYMLAEFIRGLLKAGKFSLARNYLGGTSAVSLSTEKAENLVIQAAREYFFSASTLSCNEIWKARECLNLLPNSKNVQVETDIIDALTVRLPYLGVTILPVQFRQVKDPMEIIRMVITSQTGAYLHFEEIIDVAKLLGLRSEEEIAAVEEAIAREAVVNGDLQLAFDLCLNLTKKGHGEVWDLCAAIARGPQLDNLDTKSVGELLNAWKELDVHDKFEQLMVSTGTNPPNFFVDGSTYTPLPVQSVQDILDLREGVSHDREHDHVAIAKETLSKVCMDFTNDDTYSRESTFAENRKLLSFSALELPWLLKLSNDEVHDGNKHSSETNHPIRRYRFSTKTEAINSIIYWLGVNNLAPSDDLIMFLAKSVMEPPVDEDDYVLSCSILLNLMDPFNGVKIIEEELKTRMLSRDYLKKECSTPEQRRNLLLQKFHEKFTSIDSGSKNAENVLPDIDTPRFLSGDVLLRFLGCALVSEYWDNDDILNEISEFREDIVKSAKGVIDMIYSDVYPEIDGYNKQRLSYIFGILSACHSYIKRTGKIELTYQEHVHTHKLEPFQYYKVLEEECKKVCFIDGLNYKNVAGLDNLNFDHFNEEVCKNVHSSTVSALADMVQALKAAMKHDQTAQIVKSYKQFFVKLS